MALDPHTAASRFVAGAMAAAELAFERAFRDGVDEVCAEDGGDDCDWETLLPTVTQKRVRLFAFYLPAITKMASELTVIVAEFRSRLHTLTREGASDEKVAALRKQFSDILASRNKLIANRLRQMIDGLTWAASELAKAALAQRRGQSITWVLDPSVQVHCGDCPALADGSPYPSIDAIGGVPGSDVSECAANCRCHLEFV